MTEFARTPVLVGLAQITDRADPAPDSPSPQERQARAAQSALADAGVDAARLDTVASVRLMSDSAPQYASPFGRCTNIPRAVAERLGARPARCLYPFVGGNTPQWLVNALAADIASGHSDMALITGGEAMRTQRRAHAAGLALRWGEDTGDLPETPGDPRTGVSPHELRHGIGIPTDTYPLFETVLMQRAEHSPKDHARSMGALFARLSAVAADNPHAADRTKRQAAAIATPGLDNPMIAWPYTKAMTAKLGVDQSAALVLCAEETADALGIARDKRVYLHAGADLADPWYITDRADLADSPALVRAGRHVLECAGLGLDDLDFFDLYSCFPSAVTVACRALGLSPDDPRGLTVTGGLPFFGGPGNSYTLFAIAEMAARLRGREGATGLVHGNGWYLTKHSLGLYGSNRPARPWRPYDPTADQAAIDAMDKPGFTQTPSGPGRIEAYSIPFAKQGPKKAILIGRMDDDRRFVATLDDAGDMASLMAACAINHRLSVRHENGRNRAALA